MRHIPVADSITSCCSRKEPAGRNPRDLGERRYSSLSRIMTSLLECVGVYGLENYCANISSIDKDRFIVTQYSISNEIKSLRITHLFLKSLVYFNKSSSKFMSVLCGINI